MNTFSFPELSNQNFVGRGFVFTAINNFLHRYPKGYLTIVGVPGSGKSAILAQLVRQNPDIIYYNAQIPGKNRVEEFFKDVCPQLSLWLRREIEVVNANEGSWLFSNLLQQVSERLSPENQLIIIIDGLDRVDINSQGVGTNLFYLPRYLPNQVYFIFARRPYQRSHSGLLIEAPSQVLDLADFQEENREDVREFLRRKRTTETQSYQRNIIELIKKNEDNFMYVQQILTAFTEGFYDEHDVNEVPPGLQVYYQELWDKMQGDGLSDVAVNVLGVLTAGEMQPLSMLDISKVINEDVFDVMEVLEGWLEFLQVISTGKEVKYQLYHYGFRKWLRGCLSC
ncbi:MULTISPECIES: AAA family ATPase [Cyanophyceae]|uniref:AAA family ATPase n=1 Tax=Cyanophyceae TaxID=3028117 RepID=UPI00232DC051|nr:MULTISPECIES: ATP-binding protein [Cyanophyceae]MDB9357713.1 ATP-binding protein [Nodularia spumigena CS-587/03]MDB9339627.1 ATP-binding protein [Nodularia spumigena CS-589/07]MDB9346786.1 ATP-binding protein [Nodularia spumigena CS-588/01]MDB9351356.1 ATP-binding protein [Nodularia spumigena CS-588/05]MDB9361668.1 ATP-binding protein [Nodularia spumigena CS-588/02]